MSVNVRKVCLDVLYDVNEKNEFCDTAVNKALAISDLPDVRDRGLLLALAEGTIERKIEIDYIINQYSTKPVGKLKPYVRNILRMAVYQLKYMDQIPNSAAVNEAVKLTSTCGYSGLKGFVNGILRNIARTISQVKYPDELKKPIEYLSVKYSMPMWLVEHYIDELGKEAANDVMEYYLNNSDTVIRYCGKMVDLDDFKKQLTQNSIIYEDSEAFSYAIRLKKPGSIAALPGYNEGVFTVQDTSSMIPAHIAGQYARKNYLEVSSKVLKVLDMCAAPGGKALQIAGELEKNVHVDARDLSKDKTSKIVCNAKRLGINNISVNEADALKLDQTCEDKYDIVIADLPCSGLGVVGKKPDIKYNASKNGMSDLASMQLKMLDNAADYVVRGGILLFSTCTINREENEQNARAFLNRHTNYYSVEITNYLPQNLRKFVSEEGFVKVVPGAIKADGFFVAVFRRCE